MEFSRQDYCSGYPLPPPGDLSDPGIEPGSQGLNLGLGIEPGSPTLQADSLPSEPPGKPSTHTHTHTPQWNTHTHTHPIVKHTHTHTHTHTIVKLLLGRKAMTNLDSIKKQRHYFANKGLSSQSYGFSSTHVGMWQAIRKAEDQRINAFKLWCWRRLLRVP